MISQLSQIDKLNKEVDEENKSKEEITEEFNDEYLEEIDDSLFEKEFYGQWMENGKQEQNQFSLAI
ncbi:hypothetical protein WKH56_06070 [Priestia sp. SB1]|uniref:hypothetical protein n=1 Tax=Priestia sp. SB1 TaxID=3132359 RepID=UPI00316EB1AB